MLSFAKRHFWWSAMNNDIKELVEAVLHVHIKTATISPPLDYYSHYLL